MDIITGSEIILRMLDPAGPIQWITDKFLLGRSTTNKNMLAIVGFAGRCEVVMKLEVFFDNITPIEWISPIFENNDRERFVKVVSRKRFKVNVFNLNKKVVEDFDFFNKWNDVYKEPEFLQEIISPRGTRVAVRHLDEKPPFIVVGDIK